MTEHKPTWTLRHIGTTSSSKGNIREITLEVQSPSSLRDGYIYTWTGRVNITQSGYINIPQMDLISASQNQHHELAPEIKKENQYPIFGSQAIEPNDLESACERIAAKCHQSTQTTEKTLVHLNLLKEEHQSSKDLAKTAINDMLGATR